jgi:LysM domain
MYQPRILLLAALLPVIAQAAPPRLAEPHPERYVVQPGDTLWGIAGRFLRDPWRWRDIWKGNPKIHNPRLIYPGDVLRLSLVDGAPQLTLESSGPREIKLSPKVRREVLTRPVPTIPIDAIHPFLTRPRVMEQSELEAAPRVIGFAQEHIVGGVGDPLYATGLEESDDTKYDVLRPGRTYRDPDTGEVLGVEAAYVGQAELLRPGEPAKLALVSAQREVQIDDRLLPSPQEETLDSFQPRPGPDGLEGRIISVLGGVSQIGVLNVVVLDRGSGDGLEPGHVLQILERADIPRALREGGPWQQIPDLPLEKIGALMVFRTFDRVSYALVMRASSSIHLNDTVRSPSS